MTDSDAVEATEPDPGEDPPDPGTNGHANADPDEVGAEPGSAAGAGDAGGSDDPTDGVDDAGASIGIVGARSTALEAVEQLLDHELEGVVRVESTDEGWRTLVEVVERSAVPDTQDIIGRYEVLLDEGGTVTGYGLVERYRRGEMKEEL